MAEPLVFLFDTNVFIPVEPTATEHVEPLTAAVAELERLIQETNNKLVVHPELYRDVQRDRDEDRRHLRLVLANKYARLRKAPPLPETLVSTLGVVGEDTHDWIDHHLLAAVLVGSVDFLVTEDNGVHRKAERLRVEERVLHVADALDMVQDLYEVVTVPPPAVLRIGGSKLDLADPIFDTLKADYDGFEEWFDEKVRRQDRLSWVVEGTGGGYAGVCIVKEEPPGEEGLYGSVLKVCTFRVSDEHGGYRYGELLLKVLFDYAAANGLDWLYMTVLPGKTRLIDYVADFGFEGRGTARNGREQVLAKKLTYDAADLKRYEPFDFDVRFGPPATKWQDTPAFVVPIQPRYHERLFPETEQQMSMFSGREAHGNGIKKAYLCRSNTTLLNRGDLLYFYRSVREQGITTAAVVEEVHSLSDPHDIVRAVGKRTLYSLPEITDIAKRAEGANRKVLAINFRQAKVLPIRIGLARLIEHGVVASAPQTTISIPQEGAEWIAEQTFQ